MHQLQEKNARLQAQFRLGSWPRYDDNLDAGTLIFSEQGVSKLIAEIQIAGSTSFKAGNWLWARANQDNPPDRVIDCEPSRAFREQHEIWELTHEIVEGSDLNALGWELTATMARITEAVGAYRPSRDEGGGLFLVYRSITWAS